VHLAIVGNPCEHQDNNQLLPSNSLIQAEGKTGERESEDLSVGNFLVGGSVQGV